MTPWILVNLFCVWFSWRVAETSRQWSWVWWGNMVASSLNAVVVLRALL